MVLIVECCSVTSGVSTPWGHLLAIAGRGSSQTRAIPASVKPALPLLTRACPAATPAMTSGRKGLDQAKFHILRSFACAGVNLT